MITRFRNFLYDCGLLKSHSFELPVIVVGNLSVGGTGKTPFVEYLIRLFSDNYRVATLSRGYKRQSTGFILANATSDAKILGDEPYQMHLKFPEVQVAVDADRKNGITQLREHCPKPEIILLDDAFQHRSVKAGFSILLTMYADLYADDFMLPTGNLRESRSGAKRANCIIITKCPENISVDEQNQIKKKLKIAADQTIFFTFIHYDESVYSNHDMLLVSEIKKKNKLLLAGIAKPHPFFAYLQNENDIVVPYPDHHSFSENEIKSIIKQAKNNPIITTEKDYVRLKDHIAKEQLYYLPIQTSFVSNGNNFDKILKDYVGNCTRNR